MAIFEINAYSYDEAKEAALSLGITIVKNVTQSWKAADNKDFNVFGPEVMKKNKLDKTTGVGCIVVAEAGSADKKLRPYKFVNNVVEGPIKKYRVFQVKTSDGLIVGEAKTKPDAIKLAKSIIKNYTQDLICTQVYKVDDDHEVSFRLNYAPSTGTKLGKYYIISNDVNNV